MKQKYHSMSDNGTPQAQGPGGNRALLLVRKTFSQTQENNDSAQKHAATDSLTCKLSGHRV